MTDGLIWVAGSAFDSNNAVNGGGGILLDPSCATQVRCVPCSNICAISLLDETARLYQVHDEILSQC